MAFLAYKNVAVSVAFDVQTDLYAPMSGQTANLTVELTKSGAVTSEQVTIAAAATAGWYTATFTPLAGGSPPTLYNLRIKETGAGQAGRHRDSAFQVYGSVVDLGGSWLTTLDHLKEMLDIVLTDTAQDTLLSNMIARVSDAVKSWTRRSITQTTVTRIYDAPPGTNFWMQDAPIISVASVHESIDVPRAWDAGHLIASNDYVLDSELGFIDRPYAGWFSGHRQSIRVVFDAGWASVPARFEEVALELLVAKYRKRGAGDVASRNFLDGSVSFFTMSELTAERRKMVEALTLRGIY